MDGQVDVLLLILTLLSGLGLILLGMSYLSESLQGLLGGWIRKLINKIQKNPFSSLLIGALVSFLIQSGTSASVMAVSYAGSGLLNLGQMILFLIGSNLGTVFINWFFLIKTTALDLYLLGIGFFPMFYMRANVFSSIGKAIFSLGLLLLGYRVLWQTTVTPTLAPTGMGHLDTLIFESMPWAGAFWLLVAVACGIAIAVRSTVGLIAVGMALTQAGWVSNELALMWVLGVNVGVAVPAVRLAPKSGRVALRGAMTNLLVNAVGVVVVFLAFQPFVNTMSSIVGALFGAGSSLSEVALLPMSHLTFNFGLVLIASVFYYPLKKLMLWIVPEKDEKIPQHLRFLGSTSHLAPSLAIEQVDQEVKKMAAMVESILHLTLEEIQSRGQSKENRERLLKYEGITDNIQFEIMVFLSRVMEAGLNRSQSREIRCLLKMADELESIADCCQSTVLSHQQYVQGQGELNQDIRVQFERFLQATVRSYELVFPLLTETAEGEEIDIDTSENFKAQAEQMRKEYSALLKQMKNYPSDPESALFLGRIFVNMSQIARHTWSLLEARAAKGIPVRETILREEDHALLDL